MFGLEMLDVAIGLVFVYLLLSLVMTAFMEGLESFFKLRARGLSRGISELLRGDPALMTRFYDHPVIYALYQGKASVGENAKVAFKGGSHPSYIPGRNFAKAFLSAAATANATYANVAWGVAELKSAVNTMQPESLRLILQGALQTAGDDLAKIETEIEAWYDSAMDRVSGWYKRRAQVILLVVGIGLSVALNVNTVTIVQSLAQSSALRASIVAQAEKTATAAKGVEGVDSKQLDRLGLPIGWSDAAWKAMPTQKAEARERPFRAGLTLWVGWILTGLALSLGAPFWFDVLNKLMVVRATVKPAEKSGDEKSKDPAPPAPPPPPPPAAPAQVVGPNPAPPVETDKPRPPGDTDVLYQDPAERPREGDEEAGQ